MHNKFVIVDAHYVWTGSFNFTDNCAGRNDNNALILESPELAAGYIAKFDEYWDGKFSVQAKQRSVNTRVKAGSIPIQYAFSPSEIQQEVVSAQGRGAGLPIAEQDRKDAPQSHHHRQ